MSDPIHQVLDGSRPPGALSASDAARLDAAEVAIGQALAGIRRESSPDVTRRVMQRVELLPPPGRQDRSFVRRLWKDAWRAREVTFVFRPGWALACAAVAALLVAAPVRHLFPAAAGPGDPRALSGGPTDPAPVVFVQFRLDAPDAREVHLAGDFTDWQPAHTLQPAGEGVWIVTVPVAAGVHEYAFIVDGQQWVADPLAPAVADGFGGSNSRLEVLAPSARGL